MTSIYNIYDQIAEIIARLEPEKILALKAPEESQLRFDYLASKSKESELTKQEKDELDHFIVLERLIRLAKIRAEKV